MLHYYDPIPISTLSNGILSVHGDPDNYLDYLDFIDSMSVQSADLVDAEVTLDHSAEIGSTKTSEVLTFIDSSTGLIDDEGYKPNPIASLSATKNTSLENFLSRPTLVDTRSWATSDVVGNLYTPIEPWYEFLNNAVIKKKLENYAFIRGKLCIKIVVNATPFHFGLLRVAYEPNVNEAGTGDRQSMLRTNTVSALPYVITYSQLPGTWLYPADNSGGEVHVPFFRYNNWLPLNSAGDARTMGLLYYYIASPLGVASSTASSTLTVETFVWMEEVELSGSTQELTLQAKDEYDGIISRPASAIGSLAKHFEKVPIIGRFARATTIGASAIADVASIFGFTNPPIISDVPGRVPMAGAHLASSQISTPVQKLSLDPKQELSIDPTLHGIGAEDEMSIKSIVERKSALVVDSWATTDGVGTVIFNANVSPLLFGRVEILNGSSQLRANRIYHTPMSYVAGLFQHWRGDIIFDIDVICTKFHKGRLKISWDPLGSGGATALNENTVYTSILDIGENNKASFRVPYHQAYSFLRCRNVTRDNWTVGSSLPSDDEQDNGLLIISVLTPLMSPITPSNVGVLISVRGADNLEFANPASAVGGDSTKQPPSFFAVQGKDEVDIESNIITFGDIGTKHPDRYALNYGERIVSLRSLLHRYSLYDYSFSTKTADTRCLMWGKSYSRLPPMYGYDPQGYYTAGKILAGTGTAKFNFTPTHPITYVAMMYGAFRGSVNYLVNTSSDLFPYIGDIRIQRITDVTRSSERAGINGNGALTGTSASNFVQYLFQYNGPYAYGTGGAAITNSQTNGTINWNQPQMSTTNFNYTDPTYAMTGNGLDQSARECSYLQVLLKQQTANTSTDTFTITSYAGTGPDFTCLWWLCCPTLDYYSTLPTTT